MVMTEGENDHAYWASQKHPLLSPKEELALATEFEARERKLWVVLLSFEPAVPVVCDVVSDKAFEQLQLPRMQRVRRIFSTRRSQADKWQRLMWSTACRLRAGDDDRRVTKAVLERVRGELTGSKHQRFLGRVDQAFEGQKEVKDKFVGSNLRLVISIARNWATASFPLADAVQEGTYGLIKAVERFDPSRGFKFSTYASWWIRQTIQKGMQDRGRLIRIPSHLLDQQHKIARAERVLQARQGSATTEEIAEMVGMPEKNVRMYANALNAPLSIDYTFEDSDTSFGELLVHPGTDPDDVIYGEQWSELINELLERELTEIERWIIRRRFGLETDDGLTLQQLGDMYGLSRERIRQLQEQALQKLQEALKDSPFALGCKDRVRPRITREHWTRATS